jgi:phosphoglycolate phosphatase-like HAD superfamily hydrolase
VAKIAVDIDDTLYSFTDEAREQLSLMVDEPEYDAFKDQLLHALYAKWDQWRTPFELCGVDDQGASIWLQCIDRCHDTDAILRQQPFNGAVEICNELLDQGHELVYISNRATETEEATWRWLVDNGFTVGAVNGGGTDLVVTNGDKRPFIRDCQYMIDDRVKNIIEFVYDYDYEEGRRDTVAAMREMGNNVEDSFLKRKGFVRVADYNGGLTDVPGLYLGHTWAALRRYMVKIELLPPRKLTPA